MNESGRKLKHGKGFGYYYGGGRLGSFNGNNYDFDYNFDSMVGGAILDKFFNWIKPLVKNAVRKIRGTGAGANLVKNLFRVKPPNLTEFCKFAAQRRWSLQEFLDALQYFFMKKVVLQMNQMQQNE